MTTITHLRWFRLLVAVAAAALLSVMAVACSEDDKNEARETATSLGQEVDERADQSSARFQAEALRGLIKEDDRTPDQGARAVVVIQESVEELPGDPEVAGVADADGDGLDDDGLVEVRSDQQAACLTIPGSGDEIEVSGGACG